MIDIILNVLLLLFACVATVVAIGGDTWHKEVPHLWKRITRRGRIALACTLLTLTVGIVKEVRSVTKERESSDAIQSLNEHLNNANSEVKQIKKMQAVRDAERKRRANTPVVLRYVAKHNAFVENYTSLLIADGYRPRTVQMESLSRGISVSYASQFRTEANDIARRLKDKFKSIKMEELDPDKTFMFEEGITIDMNENTRPAPVKRTIP